MNLVLLAPLGLAALAALILPILLHLHRRTRFTTVAFSALQWLTTSERPRRRPRIERWLLLLLRLLLVAALALWLARPAVLGETGSARWIVHWPGVVIAPGESDPGIPQHWLAPGFPAVDAALPPPPVHGNSASLLRELDALLPLETALTVRVPETLSGLDAQALQLRRAVDWQPVAGVAPPPAPPAAASAPIRLQLGLPTPAHPAARWLRALLAGWQFARRDRITPQWLAAEAPPTADPHIWIQVDAPAAVLPAVWESWVRQGGHALLIPAEPRAEAAGEVVWRDPVGRPLAWRQVLGRGQSVWMAQPLDPVRWPALLEPATATHLLALLEDSPPVPDRAAASAVAPTVAAVDPLPPPPRPLDRELLGLIIALFALERLVAGLAPRRPPAGAVP